MKIITTPQKSRNMKAVKSKDTKIEVKLRLALWHLGIRYRKNYKVYSCKPEMSRFIFIDCEKCQKNTMENV